MLTLSEKHNIYIVLSFRAGMHIVQFIVYLHAYINLIYIVVFITINMLTETNF